MQSNRTKAFVVLFIVAVLGGVLVYRKETATIAPPQPQASDSTTGANKNQVKGIAMSEPTQTPADSQYSDANAASHMALTATNIVWFTSYERVQNNLPPLAENVTLDQSAQLKDQDMFTYQYFDHTQPGTSITFDHFFDEAHYAFIKAGENLAQGTFSSSKQLMDEWMDSPDHRANILDPAYTQIGVWVQSGMFQGFETTLAVQHFGEPRTDCPTVDASLAGTLNSLETQLAQLDRTIATIKTSIAATSSADPNYYSLVTDYNNLADNYNQIIAEIQSVSKEYNAQVAAFDACVG